MMNEQILIPQPDEEDNNEDDFGDDEGFVETGEF